MNILPQFLLFFQTIPGFIPKSFFKEQDKCISSFSGINLSQAFGNRTCTANALFPPSLLDSAFHLWFRKGFKSERDCYQKNMTHECMTHEKNSMTFHTLISTDTSRRVILLRSCLFPSHLYLHRVGYRTL